jgi:hypothetical protein
MPAPLMIEAPSGAGILACRLLREERTVIHMSSNQPDQRTSDKRGTHGVLRSVALIAVLAGAAGSLLLMLRVGRFNHSWILLVLFTVWVLSPFVLLIAAHRLSKHWSPATQIALYCAMVLLSIASLAIYNQPSWRPKGAGAAFVFVAVAPASWLLTAIVVPLSAKLARRRNAP